MKTLLILYTLSAFPIIGDYHPPTGGAPGVGSTREMGTSEHAPTGGAPGFGSVRHTGVAPDKHAELACFYQSEQISGMNKICYYDCLGSAYAITLSFTSLCPMSIKT